jgi:hypothetical protein
MIQPFLLKKEMMFGGALDFSFLLDAPAGKHGFARIQDGHFYIGGKRVRFYGFNIAFKNLFSPKRDAEIIAERLSKAGVNFARIHAPDCIPRDGEHLLLEYAGGTSTHFDPEQWDKLDYFMYCLKQKGIYLQLDLLVRRGFLPGDGLDYPDDLFKFQKQCHVYNRRLIELQKEYANRYLTHVNPYTGMRYIEDPAVVLVQVMNENSIFWDEGTRDNIGLPSYREELNRRFNWYLLAKYGSRKALDAAWTKEDGTKGLLEDEDPEKGTVRSLKHLEGTQMYGDWKADYRGIGSPARYADYTEFLTGIQLDFAREMRDHLLALGVQCPINISNHAQGAADIYSIDRYTDVNQDNAYWNHPDPTRTGGPYYSDLNLVENDPRKTVVDNPFKLNLVTRLNHNRVAGKPFIAAEWNILYGTDFRSDALPMVAAYASLQDWDGMVLYAYHHVSSMEKYDDSKLEGPFNLYNDPATWGMVGLCSYIFQKGLIREARNHLEVGYAERDLYAVPRNWIAPYGYASFVSHIAARFIGLKYRGKADAVLSSGNTPNGDYTGAKRGLIFSRSPYADGMQKYKGLEAFLNLHRQAGEQFEVLEDGNGVDQDYRNYSHVLDGALKKWRLLNEKQGLIDDGKLVSDTDELSFDFAKGIFRADAPQIKVASGNIRGKTALGQYEFDVKNRRMTLALLALDGLDTDRSKHLLLVALGWCGNLDARFEPQPDGTRIMRDAGHGPVSVDSLEGTLKTAGKAVLYPLGPDGSRKQPLEGGTSFVFKDEGTMYFELIRE